MKVYMIPGLALSEEIMAEIKLPEHECVCLNWMPVSRQEKLDHYVERFLEKIDQEEEEKVIIGHSFGGVIAQELAKKTNFRSVILISSIIDKEEIPLRLKIVSTFGLHYFVGRATTILSFPIWARYYGYENQKMRQIFIDGIKGLPPKYMQWAIKAIIRWKGEKVENNPKLFRIHGSKDKVFYLKRMAEVDVSIEGGDHLMVYNRAAEISEKIALHLNQLVSNAS